MKRSAAVAVVFCSLTFACSGDRVPRQPTASPSPDERYVWQRGPAMAVPRTEVAVATLETETFVAGGFTNDGKASAVVETFDSSEGEWSRTPAPSLPSPLHHTAMVGYRGRLFVIGGYTEDGTASAEVWSLIPYVTPPGGQPGPGSWRREPDMPTPRGAHAAAVVGDRLHVIGGASRFGGQAKLIATHEAFDPKRRTWETLPALLGPRDHLAAASIGDDLFVVGGRKLSASRNSGRLDVFDAAENTWSRAPDMPTPRGGIAAAVLDGMLFVFGGEQPSGTFDEAEIYDPAARSWTRGPPMPTGRHGLGATPSYGTILVLGGGPEPGLSVSGAMEILAPRYR